MERFGVSIHAPTRGATRYLQRLINLQIDVSIHAPTRGATEEVGKTPSKTSMFQSTHPRGVRLHVLMSLSVFSSFNPRTHEGCDNSSIFVSYSLCVSIHAPTRGATTLTARDLHKTFGFNPRTHEGCDWFALV